jgi:hypothetical protein
VELNTPKVVEMSRDSSNTTRSCAARFLEAFAVLAIAGGMIVVMELSLRFAFPDRVTFTNDDDNWTLVPQHEFIYTSAANLRATFQRDPLNGGDVIEWSTNSLGFRGPELRPSDVRVVVYGDSNVQARFSRLEDTFPARLETFLKQKSGKDVEVVNAGVVGYGPDQSYLKMISEIDVLKPDLVVFHVFADNDFGDLLRNRLIDVADGQLVRRQDPFVFKNTSRLDTFREFLSELLITRAAHKAVGALGFGAAATSQPGGSSGTDYVNRLLSLSQQAYQGFMKGGEFVRVDHYDVDLALNRADEATRLKTALMRAVLDKVRAETDAREIAVMLLIEPSVIDVSTNWRALSYLTLSTFDSYRRERLSSLIETVGAESGLDSLNLFQLFMDNDPNTLYFRGSDNHWNERGQELAARAAADFIISRYAPRLKLTTTASDK